MRPHPEPHDNYILGALSPTVQKRLFRHLELVSLKLGSMLHDPEESINHVYFPIDAIVSTQCKLEDGATTALSVVGKEGLLGFNLFLAHTSITNQAKVQSSGYSYRLPESEMRAEFNRHGELMLLLLRYSQALIAQISQTALCNRHHSVPQQLSRWLLISLDRSPNNRLTMTQQFIANMLGVRRESVALAASELQATGAIKYSRGAIEIFDRAQLEHQACECYKIVKIETDLLLDYLPKHKGLKASPISGRQLKSTD